MNDDLSRLESLITEEDLVGIATKLVEIPSFTEHETPLAQHIRDFLSDLDIRSELQEVEPERFQTIGFLGPSNTKPALLLNGHLDMDPLGLDWPDDPFSTHRVGDMLYGPGINNMKSGLASILAAVAALRRGGYELVRPLLLEFVVGELQGGKGTVHALKSGLTAEAAVIPEPYSVRRVITRTAGVHKFAIVVRGRSAHTSRFNQGVDAVAVLRRVLDALDQSDLDLKNPDFPTLPRVQISSLLAGRGEEHDPSGISYCADKATALIDVRYPPPFDPTDVQQRIEAALVALRNQHPSAEISIEHPPDPSFAVGGADMPPMDVSAGSDIVHDIKDLLAQVSDFTVDETGIALPYSYCGNDTAHLSRAGIECCLFGPRGAAEDTEKHVLVSEMTACARTLAALALRRCG